MTSESGLAVDQETGDLYVADTANHRVDKFSSTGEFLFAFGWGVKLGDTASAGLDTCTEATSGCQAGFPGHEPGQFEEPTFIAVDNTPDGNGDVYVANDGALVNERQTVSLSGATGGSFTLSSTEFGTTESIPYNATPEQLQSVLELLEALENKNKVSVSGSSGGPYTVEFIGLLAHTNVAQMACDASGLSPAGATCTVTTSVEGFNGNRVEKFDSSGNLDRWLGR